MEEAQLQERGYRSRPPALCLDSAWMESSWTDLLDIRRVQDRGHHWQPVMARLFTYLCTGTSIGAHTHVYHLHTLSRSEPAFMGSAVPIGRSSHSYMYMYYM